MDTVKPEIASIIKAFIGAEGETVWILRVYAREEDKALVQICHVDHPLDKQFLLCSVLRTDGDKRYVCSYNEDSYVILSMEHGSGMLYLPNDMGFQINYDAVLSSNGKPEKFLNDFLEQQKS